VTNECEQADFRQVQVQQKDINKPVISRVTEFTKPACIYGDIKNRCGTPVQRMKVYETVFDFCL